MKRLLPLFWFVLAVTAVFFLVAGGKPFKISGLFLVSGLAVGALYSLGGIGLVVLYRATGVLNLANGAIGAMGVMVAWQLGEWGVTPSLTWLAALLIATLLSIFFGRLIGPGLAQRDPVVKTVATLGYALVVLGITAFIWEDDVRKFSLPTDQMAANILGLRFTVTRMIVILATLFIVFAIWLYLGKTRIGLQMRSLANDRQLAALTGIRIVKIETIAWGMSGVIAGFTGLMFGDLVRLEPFVITFMVIPSIAAAICGKLENLSGVLIGGLAMGMIESLLTLSPTLKSIRPIAPFVIAAIVLFLMQGNRPLVFARH